MTVIDVGQGPPLVLIPGIQGRWEYLQPAISALARSFRVLTFPLSGEPHADPFDPAYGLDNYTRQIVRILDREHIDAATICGISFGGLPAIRFAAEHDTRTASLVLASTPGPDWHLRPRHRLYARVPWLFGPFFFVETPFRLRPEVAVTFPERTARWHFASSQLRTLARAPLSPSRMAARAALIADRNRVIDCTRVKARTLLITGEPDLDRVVPIGATLAYANLIAGARHVTLPGTGHLGSITRPNEFAAIVCRFTQGRDPVEWTGVPTKPENRNATA